jgi:hypothetical protein
VHFSGDPFMVACGFVTVFFSIYTLGLWVYLLLHTGLKFCWIFVAVSAIALLLFAIDAVLYYDPSSGIRLLGPARWELFFYAFVSIRMLLSAIGLIGTTLLVLWVRKAHESLTHQT